MLERFRGRGELRTGAGCILIGAMLLVLAAPFVQAWLGFVAAYQVPANSANACGSTGTGAYCQFFVYIWVLPEPDVVLAASAIAIPIVLGLAWLIHRDLRLGSGGARHRSRGSRLASPLLVGSMLWMASLIAIGYAFGWLARPAVLWPWYPFLVSILIVPGILIGVGIANLRGTRWHRVSRRSPDGPG